MPRKIVNVLCLALALCLVLSLLGCAIDAGQGTEVSPPGGVSPSDNPSPSASPSPSDTPTPEPSPSPSPTPTPTPTPSPLELVEYDGPLFHVFYHFLIAFPDIAYSTSYGYDLDIVCVTPLEYVRSLEELYNNGYVLYDINKLIRLETGPDGKEKAVRQPIMVPKGKKPLIISYDDINYYSKNHGKGIGDKLILDKNGDFAMLTVQSDGTDLITYDNDCIPLMEKFIEEHPDFSPFGVRGTLALTGYDGLLGYRVNRDSPNRAEEIEAVKPVIQALKDKGWNFASHSYGHIHTKSVSEGRVDEDTRHWDEEAASLLGDTIVYIYPYGEYAANDSTKFKRLYDQGFRIFCGVGMRPYVKYSEQFVFMDRQNIDGYSLRNHVDYLKPLMSAAAVFDKAGRHEK